jgi:hypothetical protein
VVTLCRRQHLLSALVYIYNKGFDDYVTPMADLLNVRAGAGASSGARAGGWT